MSQRSAIFRGGPGGRAPGLPPTGGLLPNPSIVWLMIDVSLVILTEDFEINEVNLLLVSTALL